MNSPETAILLTGRAAMTFGTSNEQLPLLGRPTLQRAVETLVRAGIREIHVVLGEEVRSTRRFLEDGARWGCRLIYHHAHPDEIVSSLSRRLGVTADRRYLLADAARVPSEIEELLDQGFPPSTLGGAWVWHDGIARGWTGWGDFRGAWLLERSERLSHAELERCILQTTELMLALACDDGSVMTVAGLLQTAKALLARAGQPIRQGRGCKIHPNATLRAPVHLGRNVRVGAGAVIGPNAVIGDGALLERDVLIESTVVLDDTYVGEGLELRDAVIRGNRLVNARLNTLVEITDHDLLSALPRASEGKGADWRERALALALRVLLSPLRLAMGRYARRSRRATAFVATLPRPAGLPPAANELIMANPQESRVGDGSYDLVSHFRDSFYPGLRDVAAGRLRLVGPAPRGPEEVDQLHGAWRELYANAPCGLLNETLLQGTEAILPELEFAGDCVGSATQGDRAATRRLARRYLGAVINQLIRSSNRPLGHNSANTRSRVLRRVT